MKCLEFIGDFMGFGLFFQSDLHLWASYGVRAREKHQLVGAVRFGHITSSTCFLRFPVRKKETLFFWLAISPPLGVGWGNFLSLSLAHNVLARTTFSCKASSFGNCCRTTWAGHLVVVLDVAADLVLDFSGPFR